MTLSIRAFHFDMKGMIPKAEYFISLLPDFSKMGYNAILMEIEDRFPYRSHPELIHPDAWSREEFTRVREAAKQNGFTLIPLLQTAGHMDYILKHNQYAALREGKSPHDTTSQWCLKNSEPVFKLWKDLADELLAFFDAYYFHIGADEFNFSIPCDRCTCEERFGLFISHVLRCAHYICDHNRKPIVWDDTFRHRDCEELDELLSIAIPCVWQYRKIDETIIQRIQKKVPEIWGASKIQNDSTYRGMGSQKRVEKNVDDWQKILKKYPTFTGHIGTIWGRDHGLSPIAATVPQSFYMLAYLGQMLTTGKKVPRTQFQRNFAKTFFGLNKLPAIDTLGVFPEMAETSLKEALAKATRNHSILKIWQKLNELDLLGKYCDECFGYDQALFLQYQMGTVENDLTENFLDGVRITGERAEEWCQSFQREMAAFFTPNLLKEYTDSRTKGLLMVNDVWGKIISRAHDLRNAIKD